jgi:hypothetical protein
MPDSPATWIAAAIRRATTPKQRAAVRGLLIRLDNPEVRHARRLIRRLRRNPPDVLYLGDSTTLWISGYDSDQRRLGQMIRDELAPLAEVDVIAGGGYGPELHEAYLRLVAGSPARPLVVHTLAFRVLHPLIEHPAYGKRKELAAVRAIDPSTPWWRVRASLQKPGPDEFERYYRLRHKTMLGDLAVGDYVLPLKNGSLGPEEHLRMLYAYHHGAALTPESRGIDAVTQLGRRLRELGCRAVAYQTPVPVQTGVEIFGPEFEQLIASNWGVMEAAYREGFGPDATILQTGSIFSPEEFIDPADGSEHLNERGRRRLAATVVDAVRAELERG